MVRYTSSHVIFVWCWIALFIQQCHHLFYLLVERTVGSGHGRLCRAVVSHGHVWKCAMESTVSGIITVSSLSVFDFCGESAKPFLLPSLPFFLPSFLPFPPNVPMFKNIINVHILVMWHKFCQKHSANLEEDDLYIVFMDIVFPPK